MRGTILWVVLTLVAEIIVGANVNVDVNANVNALILARKKKEDVIVKVFGTAAMIHVANNIIITITMVIANIIMLAGIRNSGPPLENSLQSVCIDI